MQHPDDPFERKTVSVLGRPIRYADVGRGRPVVLLSGNATHSAQWRGVIRALAPRHRCIAPDLPGLGYSQTGTFTPGGGHSLDELSQYLNALLELLEPEPAPVIVGHELGGALGANWIMGNPDAASGFATIEGVTSPLETGGWELAVFELFTQLRSPSGIGRCLGGNAVIEEWLPLNVATPLSPTSMDVYRYPYPTLKTRGGLLRLIQDFPTLGVPGPWADRCATIQRFLSTSQVPKLQVIAHQGLVQPLDWRESTTAEVPGKHFVLEDSPGDIAGLLREWLSGVP